MLYVRMILYAVFGVLAGMSLGTFDADTGTYSITVERLTEPVLAAAGYVLTFISSRLAKMNGGKT